MAAVPIPVKAAVPRADSFNAPPSIPKAGASNGKNASGCPVTGLVVSFPVGESEAIPATSMGFIWTSMVSP